MTTTVPWGNNSGGYPKQVAKVGSKEYWRVGTNDTTWGAWKDALGTAENAQTRVGTCESQIIQLDDKITANVTEIGALQAKASTLEQTASSITSRVVAVENTEIGGRNLLFNSKGEFVSPTDASYGFWNLASDTYAHGVELKAGQSYTLSFDWSVDWGEVTPVTYVMVSVGCGSTAGAFSYDIGATALQNLSTETSGSVAFTFTPKAADLEGRPYFAMRPIRTNSADTLDGTSWTIKNVKLEKGDKATDWTPAPEDVSGDIDKAQSAADEAAKGVVFAQSQIQQLVDSISSFVRGDGGGNLVKQTEDGIYYFDISELEKNLSNTTNALDALNGIVLDANGKIDVLQSAASALQKRTEYIRSYTDENDKPCLELGEGDSTYKAYITNEGIQLMDGASTSASVSRKMLVIEKAMVRNELQIGDEDDDSTTGVWIWKRRSNGNLGLSWKAVPPKVKTCTLEIDATHACADVKVTYIKNGASITTVIQELSTVSIEVDCNTSIKFECEDGLYVTNSPWGIGIDLDPTLITPAEPGEYLVAFENS